MIKRRTNVEIIALGFALVILIGTCLLLMPWASEQTDFLDALFTATSATCVTGLVVYDTATDCYFDFDSNWGLGFYHDWCFSSNISEEKN